MRVVVWGRSGSIVLRAILALLCPILGAPLFFTGAVLYPAVDLMPKFLCVLRRFQWARFAAMG